MAVTAQAVLNVARSELGFREGRNNDTKFGRWYGLNFNPWCAMFVSWVAWKAGASSLIPKHAWTPSGANWFKARNRWGTKPKVGAIVYFDFPGDGVNRISHVGIVESIRPDGKIVTIEGNTSADGSREGNGVYRKVRSVGIVGYGYPAYAAAAPVTPKPAVDLSYVISAAKNGDDRYKAGTLLVQRALAKEVGLNYLSGPGWFGPLTKAAYAKWQYRLGFRGKDADGVPGSTSLSKLGQRHGFVVTP